MVQRISVLVSAYFKILFKFKLCIKNCAEHVFNCIFSIMINIFLLESLELMHYYCIT